MKMNHGLAYGAGLVLLASAGAADAATDSDTAAASAKDGLQGTVVVAGPCDGAARYTAKLRDAGDLVVLDVTIRQAGKREEWAFGTEAAVRSRGGDSSQKIASGYEESSRKGVLTHREGVVAGAVHRFEVYFERTDGRDSCFLRIRA